MMAECSNNKNQTSDDSQRNASTSNACIKNKHKVQTVDGGGATSTSNAAEEDDQNTCKDNQKVPITLTSVATPLLVEEIQGEQIPASLSNLLEHLTTTTTNSTETEQTNISIETLNKNDIIILFIYIIMLEEGFVPLHCVDNVNSSNISYNRQQVQELCVKIPEYWKQSNNLYEFSFVLGNFKQFVCKLLCTTCMDDLIVNCKVYGVRNGNYSMIVDPAEYVVESRTNLCKRYQNVKQFATNFKNLIGNPAKFHVLQANHVQTPTLQDLPPELKIHLEKMVKDSFYKKI